MFFFLSNKIIFWFGEFCLNKLKYLMENIYTRRAEDRDVIKITRIQLNIVNAATLP